MTPDNDLSAWVRLSRTDQGLPETVDDPAVIAALASLVHVARDTEARRRAEQAARPTSPRSESGDTSAEDTAA